MRELIERLEKAEAGSGALSDAVLTALGFAEARFPMDSCIYWRAPNGEHLSDREEKVTTSLDAALALAERVMPGLSWSVGQNVHHRHWIAYALAVDAAGLPVEPTHGAAPTPALALCIAILRALRTTEQHSPEERA